MTREVVAERDAETVKSRRLQTQLLIGTATMVVGFVLLAMLIVTVLIDRVAKEEISQTLNRGCRSYEHAAELRQEFLQEKAVSLGELAALKANLRTGDPEAVQDVLPSFQEIADTDFVLVTDADGELLGEVGAQGLAGAVPSLLDHVSDNPIGDYVETVWRQGSFLAMVGGAPIVEEGQFLGRIVLGHLINDREALEVQKITGRDVMVLHEGDLVAESSGVPQTVERRMEQRALAKTLTQQPYHERFEFELGQERVLAIAIPLHPQGGTLVLSRGYGEVANLFQKTWGWLIVAGLFILALGLWMSRRLAARLSAPLHDLVEASQTLAQGNLHAEVQETGAVEIADLGAAFNSMARRIEALVEDVRFKAVQAEEASRAKARFLASVSHELRTPLTSIRSFSEILLSSEVGGDSENAEFLTIICKESERLGRLIDEVLDLTRIESGNVPWSCSSFDLCALIHEAAAAMAGMKLQKDVEFQVQTSEKRVDYDGDRDRIYQVALNLLSNAWKFSPEFGEVKITLEATNEVAEIRVADRGPGIPGAEAKAAIFERFHQLGDTLTDKPGGTGLGLTICKEIVTFHGGEISCEDHAGGGAVLVIRLPRHHDRPLDEMLIYVRSESEPIVEPLEEVEVSSV